MRCPRCNAQVPEGPECTACGVVVEKFLARTVIPAPVSGAQVKPARVAIPAPVSEAQTAPARATGRVRLSDRRLVGLYGQLGRMLEAGLSPVEALQLMIHNTRGSLRSGLETIRRGLESGQSMAEAVVGQPGLFPESSQVLIEAGETTGALPTALQALSAAAEVRLDIRRQIVRACIYPFVLFSLVFFVPKAYLLMTGSLGAYLLASLVPYLATLAVLAAAVWLLPRAVALVIGPRATALLVRSVPGLRGLFGLSSRARFAGHLAAGLQAGLPMIASLRLAAKASGDPRFAERLGLAERVLQSGSGLYETLASSKLFDEEFLLAVAAGERVGRLDETLAQQARLLQSSLLHRLNVSVQLLSVAILLLAYLFVAQALISEYENILGGTGEQMQQLMKELGTSPAGSMEQLLKEAGGPTGASKLPPELQELLK